MLSENYSTDVEEITIVKEELTSFEDSNLVDVCTIDDIDTSSRPDFKEIIINSDSDDESYIEVCSSGEHEERDCYVKDKYQNSQLSETDLKINVAIEKNNVDNINKGSFVTRRTNNFQTTNKYQVYCSNCDKLSPKIAGKKMTTCQVCSRHLRYVCGKCSKQFCVYITLYLHLKTKCFADESLVKSGKEVQIKQRFRWKDLYELYCSKCDKSINVFVRGHVNYCYVCQSSLVYKCLQCQKRHNKYINMYLHLKNKCSPSSLLINQNVSLKYHGNQSVAAIDQKIEGKNHIICHICQETCIDANEIEYCQGQQVFQCYHCSFTCCHKSNFKHHILKHRVLSNEQLFPFSSSMKNERECSMSINCSTKADVENITSTSDILERIKDNIEIHCTGCKEYFRIGNIFERQGNCEKCKIALSYRCAVCKKSYSTVELARNHFNCECNSSRQYECHHCGYRAKQKGNLSMHIQRKHTVKICSGCGKNFYNTIELRSHKLRKCRIDAPYRCKICSFKSFYITRLKNHVKKSHNSMYRCKACYKKYTNFNSLRKHENTCSLKLNFNCDHCFYTTTVKVNLVHHFKVCHDLYN